MYHLVTFGLITAFLLSGCGGSPSSSADAPDTTSALRYIKASNTGAGDLFGYSVALSADGNTLAIGAPEEDSNTTGVNSSANDMSIGAGAVYMFIRDGNNWVQQAYLKASNTGSFARFGSSVALSADGTTLAVGAFTESAGTGAAYVFLRSAGSWSEQAFVQASNAAASAQFGTSVALSADGNVLAVGAPQEDGDATGVNNTNVGSVSQAGAVYVLRRTAGSWGHEAYVKASNTGLDDWFGMTVAVSGDGNTLAVGAINESSDGNQGDDSIALSGAAYVFRFNGLLWSQEAYVKASNIDTPDQFGSSLALSHNGDTLAVGALNEGSNATGVNGSQGNHPAGTNSGAAYVFLRTAGVWNQQAYVKASNTGADDYFGAGVALSSDGNRLAVGAMQEASNANGINGNQLDNSADQAGAAYIFTRSGANWNQLAYLKASNTGANDWFGRALSLSGDGRTLAVGAMLEDSGGSDPSNNTAVDAGAVYLMSQFD